MNMNIEDIPENEFSQFNNYPLNKKNNIDYDDILKKMGMKENNGKLFWDKKNNNHNDDNFVTYNPQRKKTNIITTQKSINIKNPTQTYNNSYIHNKYFKNTTNNIPEIKQPQNLMEYRNMLIKRIIEKKRVEKIKSRQMFFN